MNRMLHSFKTRTFRAGSLSLVLCAVAVAVAVALNVIVSLLPVAWTRLDTTADKLYALSADAKEYIASVDHEIEILYIVQEGSEDAVVKELLERACALNDRISLKTVDPALHPEAIADYTTHNQNSFVVRSEKRERVVDYTDIYQYRYYYQGQLIDEQNYQAAMMAYQYGMLEELPTSETYYAGPSVLASALDYVTTDRLPVVYQLTGHGEQSLDTAFAGYLSDDNVSVNVLTLATEQRVPEDADAVIINAPSADLSEQECSRLRNYIKGGGHVVLYTYYNYGELANLEALAGEFGMHGVSGLVLDPDPARYDTNYYMLYPVVEEHAYTSVIGEMNLPAPFAHGIIKTEQTPENVSVQAILSTSSGAYCRPLNSAADTIERADGDTDGPFMIGAGATYTENGVSGKLTWYSTPYLAMSKYDDGGTVSDLFLATVEDGCEITTSVAIATKQITSGYLSVTNAERIFWGFVMIALIPIGTLALGLFVWNKRRKR